MELKDQKCEACSVDAPKATNDEIEKYLTELSEWELVEIDNEKRIRKEFKFDDYKSSVEFTNKVADLAEEEGHHPAITTEWGKVTVDWWTHKINGLHRNDFIMAAKTDNIYGN